MYFSTTLVTLLVFSASVVATPHSFNTKRHQHAAIAKKRDAFNPSPAVSRSELSLAQRSVARRCKPRPTLPTQASTKSDTPAPAPTTQAPPQNLAPLPSVAAPPPEQHTTSEAAPSPPPPPPPPAPSPNPPPSGGSAPFGNFFAGLNQGGDGTFYTTGLGACGFTNSDSDFIAAASFLLFDNVPGYDKVNPNTNPICGKKVKVTFQGKSVEVAITDRCAGCNIATSLDFSPSAFHVLADFNAGRINDIHWEFV